MSDGEASPGAALNVSICIYVGVDWVRTALPSNVDRRWHTHIDTDTLDLLLVDRDDTHTASVGEAGAAGECKRRCMCRTEVTHQCVGTTQTIDELKGLTRTLPRPLWCRG